MNTWDKCKNCGGDRGIHHYQTDQCPVGGREASARQKQEYKSTTFEKEDYSSETIAAQAETIRKLEKILESLDALIEEQMGEWYAVEFSHLPVHLANLAHMRDAISTLTSKNGN